MMKIGRWEGNEIIYTIDVNGNSVNLMEDFDFTTDILGANMVISGMVVTEALTPDMTILISAGIAKDFTVGSFLNGEALIGIVTASNPINDRRDIIEVRRLIDNISPATRQFKDPETEDITESTIDTEVQYITEIKVLAGTPGTGLSLAVETGWIKIAEILVPAASLTVIDANIFNVDAEKAGVNNTNWTVTMASIYRNGTISEMKTKIIDNETAIALNTIHRGSDGSDHTYINQDLRTTASPTFAGGTFNGAIIDKNGLEVQAMQMETKVQTGTLTAGALQDIDITGFSFTPTAILSALIIVWEVTEGNFDTDSALTTMVNMSASYPGNEEWTVHESRGSSAAQTIHGGVGILSLTPGANKVTLRTHPLAGLDPCNYRITITAVRTA